MSYRTHVGVADAAYRSPERQIADCEAKMTRMLENRANYFKRKAQLEQWIDAGRECIALHKAEVESGNPEAQKTVQWHRDQVGTWLDELALLKIAPPGEDSQQYAALKNRIAVLKAEIVSENRTAIVDPNDERVQAARAARQATAGDVQKKHEEAQNAAFTDAALAARNAQIDGVDCPEFP